MVSYGNLVGHDRNDQAALAFVQSINSEISRRFILHVFVKVDSRMDRTDDWPVEPFDCVFFCKSLSELAADPALLSIVDGEPDPQSSYTNVTRWPQVVRSKEALKHVDNIPNVNVRTLVHRALTAIDRLIENGMAPRGSFDLYYVVQVLVEAFSRLDMVHTILTGEGRKMDWQS